MMKPLSLTTKISCLLVLFLYTSCIVASGNPMISQSEMVTVLIDGKSMKMKGVTNLSKSKQAIYVDGFYLQNEAKTIDEVLTSSGYKRVSLICRSNKLKPVTMIRAFNLGLRLNHSIEQLVAIQSQIEQFNQIWQQEFLQGDKVWVDYIPGKGTLVSLNGIEKSVIAGEAFYQAFLKTWFGDKPLSPSTKSLLLAGVYQ